MKVIIESDVFKFINTLNRETQLKVQRVLDLLEEYGNVLPMPYSKPLKKGVFELRARGKQEVRLLYGLNKHGAVVVCGFVKKTQKVPDKTIVQAIKNLKQYT